MASDNRRLEDLLAENFTEQERREIEDRAAGMLIELRLAELRKALDLTQESVAEALSRNQSAVAALEKRGDMLLSTLQRYVDALGGELEVLARFPERPTVRLRFTG